MTAKESPVRTAVIGSGWWANYAHLPGLAKNPRAEIAVVHSRTLDKAKRSAGRFGCERFTDSVEEALDTPGLRAAVIASTPNVHIEQVLAAFRRGLHVLVEKPLVLSFRDALTIQSEASRQGLHVVMSCPFQFNEHTAELRRRLACAQAGPLRLVHMLMTNYVRAISDPSRGEVFLPGMEFAERPNATSYSDPAIAGGGFSFNQFPHALGWLFHVTADVPIGVSAQFEKAGAPVELFASLSMRLHGGAIVTLAGVGNPPQSHRPFEVRFFFEHAAAFLDLMNGLAEWLPNEGEREPWATLERGDFYPIGAPVDALIELALGGHENPAPLPPAVQAIRVIEAAQQSARDGGRWVSLP
jgi:predicted dehydrogenase